MKEGCFGGESTLSWEVKFLDRRKTNCSEGVLQGYLPQSRTKVWRSKMIRDHCSPHHKRWPPWIGEYFGSLNHRFACWFKAKMFNDVHFQLLHVKFILYEFMGISSARSLTVLRESFEVTVSGGVRSQEWNLKKLTEWHHKTWSVRFNLTQHGELYQIRTGWGLTDWVFFLDPLNGGAWPLLVGGVICLVDSVNGRDPSCPVGV